MTLQDVAESGRLGPITATVNAGEILHLVGPNGAGKSTLLARMAGLASGPGSITLSGTPLDAWHATALARRRAYLTQQQTPPFAMPVWHYLTLHQPDRSHTELLHDVAGALGLDDKLGRTANQLSGGEWQRVRLAAVILQIHPAGNSEGQLLLLDEPAASLDAHSEQRVMQALNAASLRQTTLMVTHQLEGLADWDAVWVMQSGSIVEQGTYTELSAANGAFAALLAHRQEEI